MMTFKPITLEQADIISKYLGRTPHRACDYSTGNLVLWADLYKTRYLIEQDTLYLEFKSGNESFFTFPMGSGDIKSSFEWLFSYCEKNGKQFNMSLVEPSMFEEIEKAFPDKFGIEYKRNNADYVYNVADLSTLGGRKYSAKRNHINKFLKIYSDWSYERIGDANTDECIEMVKEWCVRNKCLDEKQKAEEIGVVTKGLKHRKELNLLGGVIRVNKEIIAMTLGEPSNDMFIIHFEKAYPDIFGGYPMINQQFVINELSGYKFINREEDMGIEGLRKAKESYYPAFMVEKGVLIKKDM